MTTKADYQAKVNKSAVNMDRLDAIVNGDADTVVATDGGSVPSFAKLAEDYNEAVGSYAGLPEALGAKLDKSGGTMSGAINMGGYQIGAVADPDSDDDAVNRAYADGRYHQKGQTINAGGNRVEGVAAPDSDDDAANVTYVKSSITGQANADAIRRSLEQAAAVARGPLGPRDAFDGDPIGVDPNGRTVGGITGDGYIIFPPIDVRTPSAPPRDAYPSPYYPLRQDENGRIFEEVASDGRPVFSKGLIIRRTSGDNPLVELDDGEVPIRLNADGSLGLTVSISDDSVNGPMRDASPLPVAWTDPDGFYNFAVMPDGRIFAALHPDSLAYLGDEAIGTAPQGKIAYLVGAEGSRIARLWVDGATNDVQIASDQDITDILNVSSYKTSVEVLAKTASSRRQVHIPLGAPASTLSASVTTLIHDHIEGQSNAEGFISPANPDPAITTTPLNPGRAVSLLPGERLLGNGQGPSHSADLVNRTTLYGLRDLVAMNQAEGQQTIGPTMAQGVIEASATNVGVLVTNSAIGSTSYSQRVKGTPIYANMLMAIEVGATVARLLGVQHLVRDITTIGGESDALNQAAFTSLILQWISDFNADIKRINGQTSDIMLFTDQLGIQDRALAQLQLALDHPDKVVCWGPRYHLPPAPGDTVHISTISRARHGHKASRAKKRMYVDGVNPIPLHIVSAVRSGTDVEITWGGDITGPVVIDTTTISDPGNYGLTWIDSTNSVSITSVSSVFSGNKVTAHLSGIPTGSNPRIGVARSTVANIGPTAGPRSCFRDNCADTFTFNGITYPEYNWAAHQECPVT